MPNKHAAIKDLRKNKRRATMNARLKTHVRALYAKGMALAKSGKKAEGMTAAKTFQQIADKAVKRHVLSRNAASRKKSALARALKAA
jgi:small subunit ribosomal protein S20